MAIYICSYINKISASLQLLKYICSLWHKQSYMSQQCHAVLRFHIILVPECSSVFAHTHSSLLIQIFEHDLHLNIISLL